MPHHNLQIDKSNIYNIATELEIIERTLALKGARLLELGCGRAWLTRKLAERFKPRSITATEVDRIQHEKNQLVDDLPNVNFVYGGAERIALPDASIDVVLMLKSLHHIPSSLMNQSMEEITRILKPGGLAYISEPIYRGAFNEILRLFHDEKRVRQQAFDAIRQVIEGGHLELVEQIFFQSPGHYRDFAHFEDRILKVTHTQHRIDRALYQRIREMFMAHMKEDGAHFLKPSRVDLLRKPLSGSTVIHSRGAINRRVVY